MRFMICALMISIGFAASAAVDTTQDPKYRVEIESKIKESLKEIRAAKTSTEQISAVKKLRDDLAVDKDRVRRELDRAREAKKSPDEVDRLDARDSEIVIFWYSLDTVFSSVLSESFSNNVEFKRKACSQIPEDVKFRDMAALGDNAPMPPYTVLALELASAVCSVAEVSPKPNVEVKKSPAKK